MNKKYLEFLASKARRAPMRGLDNPPKLAPHLFDFQRMSVDFSLRAGNAGLFLDTGLGKTECQARMVPKSNRGDVVLSPFMGIGSEGVMSLKHGRKFFGVELKESYWKQACKYLKAEGDQGNLFSEA